MGTVVGYQWRGKWCMRAKPRFVHNPRTEAQQANRRLFKAVVDYASTLRTALRLGLREAALELHMTECNRFQQLNKGRFALDGDGRLMVDYEALVVSEGPVAPVAFLPGQGVDSTPQSLRDSSPETGEQLLTHTGSQTDSSTIPALPLRQGESLRQAAGKGVESNTVTIPFEKNPLHMRANADDEVYLLALCPDLDDHQLSAPAYRRRKSVSITLPDEWHGHEVHLYGFVRDYAGRASASTYIGCLEARGGDEEELDGVPELALEDVAPDDAIVRVVGGLERLAVAHDEAVVGSDHALGAAQHGGDELLE